VLCTLEMKLYPFVYGLSFLFSYGRGFLPVCVEHLRIQPIMAPKSVSNYCLVTIFYIIFEN
jgi:hypothetical protein